MARPGNRWSSPVRSARWLATAAVLAAACAPQRPALLAERDRRSLGRVAVATAAFDPEVKAGALGWSRGEEVGMATLEGAWAVCEPAFATGSAGGVFGVALAGLLCLPIGAALGATVGVAASDAPSGRAIQEAQARAQRAIDALRLQRAVAEAALAYGRDMGLALLALPPPRGAAGQEDPRQDGPAGSGADTLVEIGVLRVEASTISQRGTPLVYLELAARVLVLDVRSGHRRDAFEVRYSGPARTVEAWLAADAAPLHAELDRAAAYFAEQALDEALLVYLPAAPPSPATAPPAGPPTGAAAHVERVPSYALRGIDPPIRNHFSMGRRVAHGFPEFFQLTELQPAFHWEPFPRGLDVAPGDGPGEAQQLRYDLRLFRGSELVYERRGLPGAEHRLERPLAPCQTYRWTVRARFVLDGAPRATEWTGAYDTIGGEVAPWWWRRGGVPALARVPGDVRAFYPIVETPAADGGACPGR